MRKYIVQIILFFLYVIYNLQGFLYQSGNIISQSCIMLFLVINSFFFVRVLLQKNKPLFIQSIIVFLVIHIIYSLFYYSEFADIILSGSRFSSIKNVLVAILPVFSYYYLIKNNKFSTDYLCYFVLIMLFVSICQYYFNQTILLLAASSDNVVNNTAYDFVSLCPFYILWYKKNKIISFLCVAITCFYVLQASKRGAFLIFGLFILMYLYYVAVDLKSDRGISKTKKILFYFVFILTVIVGSQYIVEMFLANDFLGTRLSSMAEGNSSGRNLIFTKIIETWFQGNSFQLFFGFGFASSIEIAGNFAHNDWLELLSFSGLLGIIVYLMLFYSSIKVLFTSHLVYTLKMMLFITLCIWFMKSIYSMGYISFSWNLFGLIIVMAIDKNSHRMIYKDNLKGEFLLRKNKILKKMM